MSLLDKITEESAMRVSSTHQAHTLWAEVPNPLISSIRSDLADISLASQVYPVVEEMCAGNVVEWFDVFG